MRRFTASTVLLLLVSAAAQAASGDWKPTREVTIVVGTGPGGGQDAAARSLQRMLTQLKLVDVPIAVVNKPGGGGAVGWTFLNQHAGDAHFLQIANPLLITNALMGRAVVTYNDVTPVATLFTSSTALSVRPDSAFRAGRDLADRLKQDSSSVSASVGSSLGYTNHIAIALLAKAAGGDPKKVKAVVFQGSGEAMTALLGGHVDLINTDASNVIPHRQAGKMRVLGVSSATRLSGGLADVPTWREQGYDVLVSTWRMLAGPRGMTQAQSAYWETVMARLVQTDEWKKELERNVFEPNFMKGDQTRPYLQAQSDQFRAVLTELGLAK
ncbi:MAG: tripartite tricarboxylate transporter substrate binding protein [Burkholderiales bacterium]